MRRGFVGISVLVVLAIILVGGCSLGTWAKNSYNDLVARNERTNGAWSQVEIQAQRRYDLIPNIVNAVKGYAGHERGTLKDVTEARAKVGQVRLSGDQLSPEFLAKFQQAQGELSSALSRLMVVVEKYPDLKANELFRDLQSQLEGTENRLAVARRDYNKEAQDFNTARKSFPKNIIANYFDFQEKPYFKSDEGAKQAPKVDFSDKAEGK